MLSHSSTVRDRDVSDDQKHTKPESQQKKHKSVTNAVESIEPIQNRFAHPLIHSKPLCLSLYVSALRDCLDRRLATGARGAIADDWPSTRRLALWCRSLCRH